MIVPLALGFSVVSFAQTAAFEGTVKAPDGKPVQGAVMKIERQDVKGNYQVKTDKKGHYFYGGLPLGSYKITVMVDGQERANQSGHCTTLMLDWISGTRSRSRGISPMLIRGRSRAR